MTDWLGGFPEWLDFIRWIIWPLVGLTVSLVTGYLFTAVALLIASPFNALLAEKAEELVTGRPVDSLEGQGRRWLAMPRGILRELSSWCITCPWRCSSCWFIRAVAAGAVPVVPAGRLDDEYPVRGLPHGQPPAEFADVKEAVRSRRLSSMGFGGLVALCTGIPSSTFRGARRGGGRHPVVVRGAGQ